MKFTNTPLNNSILSQHYLDFVSIDSTLNDNKNLTSQYLNDLEVLDLYDPKYNLTEFDIYKYITAIDHINGSLGCDKYNLTEGVTNYKNKYNNILVDLFYHNISQKLITQYPISVVFGIKQVGREIKDLTQSDINKHRSTFDYEAPECDAMNYFYDELKLYRSIYKNYSGNSYTYYVFKQLTKLFLTEVYLYNYNGFILTHKQLVDSYLSDIFNHPEPSKIRSVSELLETGEIQKVKYQCIKIADPCDINYFSLSSLKLYLIDVNKLGNFEQSYDSLIEKSFGSFWDYNQEILNKEFIGKLESSKKNLRVD